MTCKEKDGPSTTFFLFVLYQLYATTFCERSEERISFVSLQGKYSTYILNISLTIMCVEIILVGRNQYHGQLRLYCPKICPAPNKN